MPTKPGEPNVFKALLRKPHGGKPKEKTMSETFSGGKCAQSYRGRGVYQVYTRSAMGFRIVRVFPGFGRYAVVWAENQGMFLDETDPDKACEQAAGWLGIDKDLIAPLETEVL